MATEQDLRDALSLLAERAPNADSVFADPVTKELTMSNAIAVPTVPKLTRSAGWPIAALKRKRFGLVRRYRTVATMATAAATVLVVALAVTLANRSRSLEPLPTPHTSPQAGNTTVGQLLPYRWEALPDAPIPVRQDGVVGVWTGNRMIVWGGSSSGGQVHSDGASYDPATRTWERLPTSPLGPRTDPAYAWTGSRLFIWGGSTTSDQAADDGATYDPATRSWHRLPPLSLDDPAITVAVWTGSRVVLFTAGQDADATTVAAHAYDPTSDTWSALPSIHITQTSLLDLSALIAGNRIYVWMPVQSITNRGLRTGNDGYVYRAATNSWTPIALLPTQGQYSVGAALWTGDHIIFEPNGLECSCGGLAGSSTGSWADPRTGIVTALPPWLPPPSEPPTVLWTGGAVLALAGPRAAAWDPKSDHWAKLASPPYLGGAVRIWTGKELLVWGQLSHRAVHNPNAGSPPPAAEPTGLELKR
jgi:N-acetylneuraminic acid mutarotase